MIYILLYFKPFRYIGAETEDSRFAIVFNKFYPVLSWETLPIFFLAAINICFKGNDTLQMLVKPFHHCIPGIFSDQFFAFCPDYFLSVISMHFTEGLIGKNNPTPLVDKAPITDLFKEYLIVATRFFKLSGPFFDFFFKFICIVF